jgi:fused signal recognition particle receptor
MDELSKIGRIISQRFPEAKRQNMLVLDATTGQNALMQAKGFSEAVGIDGIILNKLDGTAKGGVAVAIAKEMNIPIMYIGVGEGIDDLRPFDAEDFAKNII